MMTNLFVIIFLSLYSVISFSQNSLDFIQNLEPGKVYAKCMIQNLDKKDRNVQKENIVLIIQPNIWESQLDTVFMDKDIQDETIRVMTKEAGATWLIYTKKIEKRCISTVPGNCLFLALKEAPAEYLMVKKDSTNSFQIIEKQALKTKSTIVVSENSYEAIEVGKDQVYTSWEQNGLTFIKTKKGYWTAFREVICPSVCGPGYTIRQIQTKLKEHGYYKGPCNNIMSIEVKQALVNFQKDRGILVRQLDMNTLKELGIVD